MQLQIHCANPIAWLAVALGAQSFLTVIKGWACGSWLGPVSDMLSLSLQSQGVNHAAIFLQGSCPETSKRPPTAPGRVEWDIGSWGCSWLINMELPEGQIPERILRASWRIIHRFPDFCYEKKYFAIPLFSKCCSQHLLCTWISTNCGEYSAAGAPNSHRLKCKEITSIHCSKCRQKMYIKVCI